MVDKLFSVKDIKLRYIKELQLENILTIFVTAEVSKYLKSNEINDVHPQNKQSIILTEDVLKLLRTKEVNCFKLAKKPDISVTFEVSNFVTSIFEILVAALNII